MSISEEIKKRIQEADKRFHSNDNISEFIKEGELDLLQNEVEEKLKDVLDSLVIDTTNDHNTQDTSRRVAKMWIKETFSGRYKPAGDFDSPVSGLIRTRSPTTNTCLLELFISIKDKPRINEAYYITAYLLLGGSGIAIR